MKKASSCIANHCSHRGRQRAVKPVGSNSMVIIWLRALILLPNTRGRTLQRSSSNRSMWIDISFLDHDN